MLANIILITCAVLLVFIAIPMYLRRGVIEVATGVNSTSELDKAQTMQYLVSAEEFEDRIIERLPLHCQMALIYGEKFGALRGKDKFTSVDVDRQANRIVFRGAQDQLLLQGEEMPLIYLGDTYIKFDGCSIIEFKNTENLALKIRKVDGKLEVTGSNHSFSSRWASPHAFAIGLYHPSSWVLQS